MHAFAARTARGNSRRRNIALPQRMQAVRDVLHGTGIQAKLRIGAVNDPAEAEADRIAHTLMHTDIFEERTTNGTTHQKRVYTNCLTGNGFRR